MAEEYNIALGVDASGAKEAAIIWERSAETIKGAADAMSKSVDNLSKKNEHVATSSKKLTESTSTLGSSLGMLKGLFPIVSVGMFTMALRRARQDSLDFNKAITEIDTVMGKGYGKTLEEVSKQVKELSIQYGQVPTTQAKALYEVISAGATTAERATNVLTTANKLAVGGITDVMTAADGLTSIMNAYGLGTKGVQDASDSMFVAMAAGKTTIGELANTMGQVAPFASKASVSIDELFGTVAALTLGGLGTSEAMTSLRQMLQAIIKPSDDAAKAAAELGVNFTTAGIKMAGGFVPFMQDIIEKTGGSEQALARLFPQVQGLSGVLALTGEAGKALGDIMQQMIAKYGATQTAVDKVTASFSFQSEQMKSKMEVAWIEIGDLIGKVFAPVLMKLNKVLDTTITALTDINASFESMGDILEQTSLVGTIDALFKAFDNLTLSGKAFVTFFGVGGAVALGLASYPLLVDLALKAFMGLEAGLVALKTAAVTSGAAMSGLGITLTVLAAAAAGVAIGTKLREEFVWAEEAGIVLSHGLMLAFEDIKYVINMVVMSIEDRLTRMVNAMRSAWADVKDLASKNPMISDERAAQLQAEAAAIRATIVPMKDYNEKVNEATAAHDREKAAIRDSMDVAMQHAQTRLRGKAATDAVTAAEDAMAEARKRSAAANAQVEEDSAQLDAMYKKLEGSTKDVVEMTEAETKAFDSLLDAIDPLKAATQKTKESQDLLVKAHAAGKISSTELAKYQKLLARQLEDTTREFTNQENAAYDLIGELDPLVALNREYIDKVILLDRAIKDNKVSAADAAKYYKILHRELEDGAEKIEKEKNVAHDLILSLNPLMAVSQQYAADQKLLNQALADGSIKGYQHADAMKLLNEQYAANVVEAKKSQAASYPWGAAWEEMIKRIDDAFYNLWDSAFDGFDSFLDAMTDALRVFATQTLHNLFTKPLAEGMSNMMAGAGFVTDKGGNPFGSLMTMGAKAMDFFKGFSSGGLKGGFNNLFTGFTGASAGFDAAAGGVYAGNLGSATSAPLSYQLANQAAAGQNIGILGRAYMNTSQLPGGIVGGGLITAGAGMIGNVIGQSIADTLMSREGTGYGGAIGGVAGGVLGAGSAAMGAQFGAWAGPIGALAGAAIGAIIDEALGGSDFTGKRVKLGVITGKEGASANENMRTLSSGLRVADIERRADDAGMSREDITAFLTSFDQLDKTLTEMSRAAGIKVDFGEVTLKGPQQKYDGGLTPEGFFGSMAKGELRASMGDAPKEFVKAWIAEISGSFDEALQPAMQKIDGSIGDMLSRFGELTEINSMFKDTDAAVATLGELDSILSTSFKDANGAAITFADSIKLMKSQVADGTMTVDDFAYQVNKVGATDFAFKSVDKAILDIRAVDEALGDELITTVWNLKQQVVDGTMSLRDFTTQISKLEGLGNVATGVDRLITSFSSIDTVLGFTDKMKDLNAQMESGQITTEEYDAAVEKLTLTNSAFLDATRLMESHLIDVGDTIRGDILGSLTELKKKVIDGSISLETFIGVVDRVAWVMDTFEMTSKILEDLSNIDVDKTLADIKTAVEESSLSVYESWKRQGDAIKEMSGSLTTADDYIDFTNKVVARYQTELQLLAEVNSAIEAIKGTFAGLKETILLDTLQTPEEKVNYYAGQMDMTAQSIAQTTDPTEIIRLMSEANRYATSAYNATEDKAGYGKDLMTWMAEMEELAAKQLGMTVEEIREQYGKEGDTVASAITTALEGVNAKMLEEIAKTFEDQRTANTVAAQKQQEAASSFNGAVASFGGWVQNLPSSINVNVDYSNMIEVNA